MPAPPRGSGAVSGCCSVHWVPSQVHVSPKFSASLHPPKRTISWRASSHAMAAPRRGEGAVAVSRRVHAVPSHDQVSSESWHGYPVQSVPPNSNTRWRTGSYAIPGEVRCDGEWGAAMAGSEDRGGRTVAAGDAQPTAPTPSAIVATIPVRSTTRSARLLTGSSSACGSHLSSLRAILL